MRFEITLNCVSYNEIIPINYQYHDGIETLHKQYIALYMFFF